MTLTGAIGGCQANGKKYVKTAFYVTVFTLLPPFFPTFAFSQLPEVSQKLVSKLESWEADQQSQLDKQIAEKRGQVITILRKHLVETTKSGAVLIG